MDKILAYKIFSQYIIDNKDKDILKFNFKDLSKYTSVTFELEKEEHKGFKEIIGVLSFLGYEFRIGKATKIYEAFYLVKEITDNMLVLVKESKNTTGF